MVNIESMLIRHGSGVMLVVLERLERDVAFVSSRIGFKAAMDLSTDFSELLHMELSRHDCLAEDITCIMERAWAKEG